MAFLDNSGDIILQTVLTDLGRKRLAEGNFKITKFALGDDEINYGSYNSSHASGSAYYDLEILQTPILEPVTDNYSALKSRLMTIANPNLLYLPVLKLNTVEPDTKASSASDQFGSGSHVLMVDQDTVSALTGSVQGYINGYTGEKVNGRGIRVDQGLDTTELSAMFGIQPDLKETQYLVEMDSRLLSLYDVVAGSKIPQQPISVDDDQIATYFLSQNVGQFVKDCAVGPLTGSSSVGDAPDFETVNGPRGTKVKFGLLSSAETQSSDYLFTLFGSTLTVSAANYYYIDTVVRVTGVSTGYRLDVPVRLVKAA
jgi:hypothetical protein